MTDGEVKEIEEIKSKALKMINENAEKIKRGRKLEIINCRKIREKEKRTRIIAGKNLNEIIINKLNEVRAGNMKNGDYYRRMDML